MKRFIWADNSIVYHDRLEGAVEQCQLDDLKRRNQGDEPPRGRRLCKHCHRMQVWRRGIATG